MPAGTHLKEIRRLFREFQNAGDTATKTKARLVEQIVSLLMVHTYIENEMMYPEVRALLPDLGDDVLESYEEHHVADVPCMELSATEPTPSASTPRPRCLSGTSPITS